MSLGFHFEKQQYVDKKGLDLISLVVSRAREQNMPAKPAFEGHWKHKDIVNLGEVANMHSIKYDSNERYISKFTILENAEVGLDEKGFQEIYGLTKQILKEQSFREKISEEFLINVLFDWTMNRYHSKSWDSYLSDYIIEKCESAIETYNVYVPVLFLESNREIDFGFARFEYLTDEYLIYLSSKIEEPHRNHYVSSFQKFKGQLFGIYSVNAEKEKAIEIAIGRLALAVDILRTCSPATTHPEIQIYFDLDFRCIYQLKSDTLIQRANEPEHIVMNFVRHAAPFVITDAVWHGMMATGLPTFTEFARSTLTKATELQSLILNAIANFSKAISYTNLHERIVKLFTVLESLLLASEDVAIVDSVSKYLPKIVATDINERREIVDAVKRLYQIRSALIHHGRNKDFEIQKLALLQSSCYVLILRMIILSKTKNTKLEILQDIDDRIMGS